MHVTGIAALVVNVFSLLCRCEVALRRRSVFAGCLWALNNVLLGAPAAAALSVVSAGRTASSARTLDSSRVARRNTCIAFLGITLCAGLLTWSGWISGVTLIASMLSTYAMFYLRGAMLRISMLLVSALWMINALQYGSWEQMAANVISALAAAYGAWRLRPTKAPALALGHSTASLPASA